MGNFPGPKNCIMQGPGVSKNQIYICIFNFRLTMTNVESFTYKLRSTPWVELHLPYSITTQTIEIKVIGVENILFGGFKEIKLFGCGPTLDDWDSGMNIFHCF